MKSPKFEAGTFVQGVILLGFTIFLLKFLVTGGVYALVAPYLVVLLWITAGVFGVLTFFTLSRIFRPVQEHDHHGHSHSVKPGLRWLVLTAPVVVGLVLPTHALGTAMLTTALKNTPRPPVEAVSQKATQPAAQESAPSDDLVDLSTVPHADGGEYEKPVHRPVGSDLPLDELMFNILVAPEYYYNQTYQYTGFVYHPPGWPQNRLVLLRYMISCCTADATPLGVTVEWKDADKYKNDQWLTVEGTLSLREIADADEIVPIAWYQMSKKKPAVIAKNVKPIDEPKIPYLGKPVSK
ncbi:TIGR03943 family putative permease subunit [Tumebacillus flagellatus]|nr:TIGR03943 family protein [Tumebacillus flagellatus]